MSSTTALRRPMPLASESVVVDTLRLEAQQRVTAWKSHERACPRCQVGDHCCIAEWLLDLAEDAGNRLERAIAREVAPRLLGGGA